MAEATDDFHEAANPGSQEQIDLDGLMADYDWQINVPTDPDDPDFRPGLDMIDTLRKQYGTENVVVNEVAKDVDTDQLAKVPGRLGIHVRKGAVRLDG